MAGYFIIQQEQVFWQRPEIMVSFILNNIVIFHNPGNVDLRMWEALGDIFGSLRHRRSINKHGERFLTVLWEM